MSLPNPSNHQAALISSIESLQTFLPAASPAMIQERARRSRTAEPTIARVGPSGLVVASMSREGEFSWGFSLFAMVRLARQGFAHLRSRSRK